MSTAELPDDVVRAGSEASCIVSTAAWNEFWDQSRGAMEAYQCRALLCPEPEGGFSAHCVNLRGVISQGDSEAEAIENIADAFRETLLYCRDSGEKPLWGSVEVDAPPGTKEKWILVRL